MNSFIENVNYVANLDNKYGKNVELFKNNISLRTESYDVKIKFTYYNYQTGELIDVLAPYNAVSISGFESMINNFKSQINALLGGNKFVCTSTFSYTNFVINNVATVYIKINSLDDMIKTYGLNITITSGSNELYNINGIVNDTLKILPSVALFDSESLIGIKEINNNIVELNLISSNINEILLANDNATSASENAIIASNSKTSAIASASTATTKASEALASATSASASASTATTKATEASASAASALASKNAASISETNALASKNAASTSETNALASKNAAATSATNAATSETNALASKNAAATSATSASGSATTATTKASEASTSATNAATSATASSNSATASATSATNAATSATSASTSSTSATASATSATTSASTATTKAAEAVTSATNAASSATSASTSSTNASNSATAAATSATNAASSATSANTSATSATASKNAASTSESNAAASATLATTKATEASASATAASTSATNASASSGTATTQATNAGTSATNASNSATSAGTSATTATTKASEASTSASNAAASATASATSATNSATSATASATSATNSANSATAAAASAASAAAIAGGSISLDSLNNVTAPTPANGDILSYVTATTDWRPLSILPVAKGGTGVTSSTGSGNVVLSNSPTLVTPILGVATGTSFNGITGLSALTPIANGTAAIGTATTAARADHVHALQSNLSGSSVNAIHYQSAANVTSMLSAPATSGMILSNSGTAPVWISPKSYVAKCATINNIGISSNSSNIISGAPYTCTSTLNAAGVYRDRLGIITSNGESILIGAIVKTPNIIIPVGSVVKAIGTTKVLFSSTSITATSTGATGNGTTATLTYADPYPTLALGRYIVGATIVVAGFTPTTYNGTYVVTAVTATSVSYSCTETATATVNGTITQNNADTGSGSVVFHNTISAIGTIDGSTLSIGDLVLVKDQTIFGNSTSMYEYNSTNGLYSVTSLGSTTSVWSMTKVTAASNPGVQVYVSDSTYFGGFNFGKTFVYANELSSSYCNFKLLDNNYSKNSNYLINGNFDFWDYSTSQTGVTGTLSCNNVYNMLDKYSTGVISRVVNTPSSSEPYYISSDYSLSKTISTADSGAAANADDVQRFAIEDITSVAGKTLTLSFHGETTGYSRKVAVSYTMSFGTTGTPTADAHVFIGYGYFTVGGKCKNIFTFKVPSLYGYSLGTNYKTHSYLTINICSNAGTFSKFGSSNGIGYNNFDTFILSEVVLEDGVVSTQSSKNKVIYNGIHGKDSIARKRYYQKHNLRLLGYTTGELYNNFAYPVEMRTVPTVNNIGTGTSIVNTSATGFTTDNVTEKSAGYYVLATTAGRTGYQGTIELKAEIM